MKSILLSLLFASTLSLAALQAQPMASDNKMARPLGQVLDRVEQQFGVRFKYNVDTTGLVLNPRASCYLRKCEEAEVQGSGTSYSGWRFQR